MKEITLAVILMLVMPTAAPARDLPHWWTRQCRFQLLDGKAGFATHEVARTIRCATWKWYRGHTDVALCIAHRESGDALYPYANNPSSSASGIFQVLSSTFDSWWTAFNRRAHMYKLDRNVFDARTNVMVSTWAMDAYGLGAWSGSC